jgi:transcriptional regulator with XRE-family HTH domain
MKLNERLDKFEKLVSKEPSNFISKLAYYKANKSWLNKSAMIAVNVLEALKDKKLSQKQLAAIMNVSAQQINKIVKGQENLTIETICKLENALQIELINAVDYVATNELATSTTLIKSIETKLSTSFFVRSESNFGAMNEKPTMTVVHNTMKYSAAHNLYAKAN